MKYADIEPMCHRYGHGLRGCPWDGLGCTGGQNCSINRGGAVGARAYNATEYGPDFECHKRNRLLAPKDAE